MSRRSLVIGLALILSLSSANAGWKSKVRAGDKLYQKGQYEEALVKYLEALGQDGDSTLINFGLGNVFHAQEKFPEAGQSFINSLTSPDSALRADALYNLGNALFGQQQYGESAEAYKSALQLKPRQMDYLHNLQLAEYLLKNPPPQQQPDQDQEKNQQEQNQDQGQDQQEQQDSQQEQQEQPEEQQQPEQEQRQQLAQSDSTMSKEDAERLLNALLSDERQVQENLRRQETAEGTVGKDW